jgi:thioredoxin-like negative regulator of GroEL
MNSESVHNQATSASQEQLEFIADMLTAREYAAALAKIEQIPVAARTPLLQSAYALCLAEVKQTLKAAVNLCHDAIKKDPKTPEHYSRQGRILLLAGRRKDAIWILRMGLRHGKHRGIVETLGSLGIRRPPPLPMLSRDNPLNKYLGKFLTKLSLR